MYGMTFEGQKRKQNFYTIFYTVCEWDRQVNFSLTEYSLTEFSSHSTWAPNGVLNAYEFSYILKVLFYFSRLLLLEQLNVFQYGKLHQLYTGPAGGKWNQRNIHFCRLVFEEMTGWPCSSLHKLLARYQFLIIVAYILLNMQVIVQ